MPKDTRFGESIELQTISEKACAPRPILDAISRDPRQCKHPYVPSGRWGDLCLRSGERDPAHATEPDHGKVARGF
jgi:hypothetical protein